MRAVSCGRIAVQVIHWEVQQLLLGNKTIKLFGDLAYRETVGCLKDV
jgi:hypothetical protein